MNSREKWCSIIHFWGWTSLQKVVWHPIHHHDACILLIDGEMRRVWRCNDDVSFPIVHSLLSLLLGFCQLIQPLDVIRIGELNLMSVSLGGAEEPVHFSGLRSMCTQCWLTKNFFPGGVRLISMHGDSCTNHLCKLLLKSSYVSCFLSFGSQNSFLL
jgi:hypothetical protein